jgi:hypothetical protein
VYGHEKCISGTDEQLIAETMIELDMPWTMLGPEYGWLVGKTEWLKEKDAIIWQWYNTKPWTSERGKWTDLVKWYEHWDAITTEVDIPTQVDFERAKKIC